MKWWWCGDFVKSGSLAVKSLESEYFILRIVSPPKHFAENLSQSVAKLIDNVVLNASRRELSHAFHI